MSDHREFRKVYQLAEVKEVYEDQSKHMCAQEEVVQTQRCSDPHLKIHHQTQQFRNHYHYGYLQPSPAREKCDCCGSA